MSQFIDQNGNQIGLGRKLGAGGEATAYEVDRNPKLVIKIYHEPAEPLKAEKLSAMAGAARADLLKFAAWPQAIVRENSSGPVRGVIMPRVQGEEIHTLYTPSNRKQRFPKADWRFLARTAYNFASAIQTLHKYGIVIGDINQGNSLVDENALVHFIDCDSFQIKSSSRTFRCEVGVPHFTPPELQNSRFSEVDRQVNHDCFGLAVMVFHLLYAGRHPYVGRYGGQGDLTVEQAIEQNRFAFGRNRKQFLMEPPPNCPLLGDTSPQIVELFERAFRPEAATGLTRPRASDWTHALRSFEASLVQCRDDPGHYYARGNSCPWCRIAKAGGPNFFVSVSFEWFRDHLAKFDLSKTWNAIEAIPTSISNLFSLPPPTPSAGAPTPPPLNFKAPGLEKGIVGIAALVCAVFSLLGFAWWVLGYVFFSASMIFGSWWLLLAFFSPRERERRLLRRATHDSLNALANFDNKLIGRTRYLEKQLSDLKEKARLAKNQLETLDQRRLAEIQDLREHAEERQMADHLKSKFICDYDISGIGPARIATLESYGIETAFDVVEDVVLRIPGFGPKLTWELVFWRKSIEVGFRFDPSKGVPQSDIQAIDLKYGQLKLTLQKDLLAFPQRFASQVKRCRAEIQGILPQRKAIWQKASQALANAESFERMIKGGRA
jgi:DNA-binding helix-hairpin-helix protein with protein kinase domain